MNILLGLTGSVATTVVGKTYNSLMEKFPDADIQIVATNSAIPFLPSGKTGTTFPIN